MEFIFELIIALIVGTLALIFYGSKHEPAPFYRVIAIRTISALYLAYLSFGLFIHYTASLNISFWRFYSDAVLSSVIVGGAMFFLTFLFGENERGNKMLAWGVGAIPVVLFILFAFMEFGLI